MKKKLIIFVLALFAVGLVGGVVNEKNVSAAGEEFVNNETGCSNGGKKVYVPGGKYSGEVFFDCVWVVDRKDDNYRWEGGRYVYDTTFYLKFHVPSGSFCTGSTCQVWADFKCTSPGKAYTTLIDDSKTKIEYHGRSAGGFDYYGVTLYPFDSNYQTMNGELRVWAGEESNNLWIQNKNIYNNEDIGSAYNNHDVVNRNPLWVRATRVTPVSGAWKFIGWKTDFRDWGSGLNGIMTRGVEKFSDIPNNAEYAQYLDFSAESYNNGAAYYNNQRSIWNKVYVRLQSNSHTMYAYYAKMYTLQVNAAEGTTVSVERPFSMYSFAGNVYNSSNGDTNALYLEDRLKICVSVEAGYELTGFRIKTGGEDVVNISPSGRYCLDTNVNIDERNPENMGQYFRVSGDTVITTEAQESTNGGSVDVSVNVKNNDVAKYNNYQEQVFAKPGDRLTFKAFYSSGALNSLINNYETGHSINLVGTGNVGLDDLKNAFTLKKSWGGFEEYQNYVYDFDKNNVSKEETNDRIVGKADVGEILKEEVGINVNDEGTPTPGEVTRDGSNWNVTAERIFGGEQKTAQASVPYNFINKTRVKTEGNQNVVYAGETNKISYTIDTLRKYNDETSNSESDIYATMVKNARWRVELCYDLNDERKCKLGEEGSGDLHVNEDINVDSTKDDDGTKTSLEIPDLPAGTEVSITSMVYPKDSGSEINLSESPYDINDPLSWAYSEPVKFTIAKRPSFQVWGGNIYSAKDVGLSMSVKNNLADEADYPYNMTDRDKVRVFGSWAELSLVAEGEVRGLASGAGLGYGTTTDAGNASQQKTIETLGGRDSSDYCLMSTLSIANSNCNSASAGVGNLDRSSGGSGDKSSLISDFVQEGDQFNIEGEFSLSGVDDNRKTDKGVYYYDGKNKNLSISESAIGAGATKVVRTNNDIAILGNIVYQNEGYSNLESIPKIIIYAKNINISCSVTRVDAVLIADEKINTCSDNITDNSSLRSTPLMIRGSVISDTLTLGRTYGAATGKNSVIPAEIINYDTSLYLWANNQSSATTPGKLTETYINELAPRY